MRVVPVDGPFSRGRGLNQAAAQAASDRLLLCDADMLIKPAALRRAIEVLDRGAVWFPICRYLDEEGRAGILARVRIRDRGDPAFDVRRGRRDSGVL